MVNPSPPTSCVFTTCCVLACAHKLRLRLRQGYLFFTAGSSGAITAAEAGLALSSGGLYLAGAFCYARQIGVLPHFGPTHWGPHDT